MDALSHSFKHCKLHTLELSADNIDVTLRRWVSCNVLLDWKDKEFQTGDLVIMRLNGLTKLAGTTSLGVHIDLLQYSDTAYSVCDIDMDLKDCTEVIPNWRTICISTSDTYLPTYAVTLLFQLCSLPRMALRIMLFVEAFWDLLIIVQEHDSPCAKACHHMPQAQLMRLLCGRVLGGSTIWPCQAVRKLFCFINAKALRCSNNADTATKSNQCDYEQTWHKLQRLGYTRSIAGL